ncbi:MAG: ABC transporter permease [Bdellovibrionaceae bacterium]|nr:ABC transporter permease [Pseudobdellovibrionaceae bacterium]
MGYLCIRAAYNDRSQGIRTIFSVVSAQVYFTGWQALPIISTLAIGSGAAVILQSSSQINLLGGVESIGAFMMVIVVRELAPLLTALIVVARSGTAVASEIGSMRVQREVDALENMGINPLSYIVFPRLMGGVISVLCLAFYYIMIAIFGGYVITIFQHQMDFYYYLTLVIDAVSPEDFFLFFTKNIFSGAIIFLVCCRQGMSVVCSSHEVPQVTTKAVFMSIKYIVGFHICVTALFYLNRLIKLGVI